MTRQMSVVHKEPIRWEAMTVKLYHDNDNEQTNVSGAWKHDERLWENGLKQTNYDSDNDNDNDKTLPPC